MGRRKLPVIDTVRRAYRLLAQDWSVLLRIIPLPLAVLLAFDYRIADIVQSSWTDSSFTRSEYASDRTYYLFIFHMALALFLGAFIVALWHRVCVGGREVLSVFGLLSAWRNIASLTLHWSALILIAIGVSWVVGSALGTSATAFVDDLLVRKFSMADHPAMYRIAMNLLLDTGPLLVSFYISGRLALMLSGRLALMLWARPAGGRDALENAWRASTGNGWRIAAAIFLATLPVLIIDYGLPPMLGGHYGALYEFVRFDISVLLQLIVAAAAIAAAHRFLLERGGSVQRGPTP